MTLSREQDPPASPLSGRLQRIAARLRQTFTRGQRPAAGDEVRPQTARRPGPPEALDLLDPAVAGNPFPLYEELRRGGSVHFLARHGYWLVVGYDEVQAALARPQVFSSRSPEWTAVDGVLLGADPPEHTFVRRAVGHLFSAEALEAQAAFAERAAERLLGPLVAGQPLEVLREFAAPLSEEVVAHLVGFDEAALAGMRAAEGAAQDLGRWLGALDSAIADAAGRTRAYGRLLREGGAVLGHAELRSLVRFLWIAGTTTTRRTIASSVLMLLRHPEARRRVESDPSLLPAFVEESLRLAPPEHTISRVTTAETELSGVRIPPGSLLKLCVAAANRDPAHFADPASFLLPRAPNRHLSFGVGIHRCLGAPLARAEMAAALRALLRLAPRFRPVSSLDALGPGGFAGDTGRLLIEC